jgi:predicted alpha/beta hydrolase family esterase
MKKKLIIVHCWDGTPDGNWYPWLKQEAEKNGFEVVVPEMPETEEPRIFNWVPKLKEVAGTPDENTYFIGHSIGCQTIARFLETLDEGVKVGGVIFVAGFFKELTNLEGDEVTRDVVQHWLGTPINLEKVKSHMKNSVAIFSYNDQYVPATNIDAYRDVLGSEIIVEHAQNHFSKISELPVALESLLKISN